MPSHLPPSRKVQLQIKPFNEGNCERKKKIGGDEVKILTQII